ncbi:MAG: valine--pyruvate transaminase [Congregibacter sp.]
MKLSTFGQKFAGESAIGELMEDLGESLAARPAPLFMGGGNPGRIDAVQEVFAAQIMQRLDDPAQRHEMLGVYQPPDGDAAFRSALADTLNERCGWGLSPQNIAIANGSQSACFILFNLFAGEVEGAEPRSIHLPITPEYVGYADLGLTQDFFSASAPVIERMEQGEFKYRPDFDDLAELAGSNRIGAVCVSRPSNPSGNVVSDEELGQLSALAASLDVPLIVDGAYGHPFPSLIYDTTEATPFWDNNTILMLSLSKLGLPGIRSGVIVASEPVIQAFNRANTVLNLACGNLGPSLLTPLLQDGTLRDLCQQSLLPYYRERRDLALSLIREQRGDLPIWVHRAEGAFFLWIWCEGLPIDSMLLYRRLKARGVLVLPGNGFFMGSGSHLPHARECLRISYAGDTATIRQGITVIMDELRRCYAEDSALP